MEFRRVLFRSGEASGEVWSVHGGGFYHNEKYQVAPSHMPDDLHWFKWEAYFTWISGFSLLVLVYYVGAKNFLIDPAKMALGAEDATIIGLSALIAGRSEEHTSELQSLMRTS